MSSANYNTAEAIRDAARKAVMNKMSTVDEMIKRHVEAVLDTSSRPDLSNEEIKARGSKIVDSVMSELRAEGGDECDYKYVISCTVMPKNGAGLHSAASCYWDNRTDGGTTVRWENRFVTCVVNVFVLAN